MPLKKIQFVPTINKESTSYSAEGAFRDCDKIRFRSGFPEKIGGWVRLSINTFKGICRSLWSWSLLNGETVLGVGTHLKYYIERGGVYNDITPIRRIVTLTNPITTVVATLAEDIAADSTMLNVVDASFLPPFGRLKIDGEVLSYTTIIGNTLQGITRGAENTSASPHTSGSSVLVAVLIVSDTAHGARTTDFVTLSGSGTVGGAPASEVFREHMLYAIGENQFFVEIQSFPTTAVTGGDTVTAEYQERTGQPLSSVFTGWGAGDYGEGAYGLSVSNTGMRIWNHANFGEDLIFGPRGGTLNYWDATLGFESRGVRLSSLPGATEVPLFQNQILVTEARFVIAFGANEEGKTVQDPMLVRWSDQEKPQVWGATATNLAGDFRLANGTRIITAVQTRQEILVFTDTAVYSMQFLQTAEVFGFTLLADNISIASPNSVSVANNVVYWMGKDKFYIYDGRVQVLPCSVRQFVFGNLNPDQVEQVYAGLNPGFNEVWWFYTDTQAMQNNRYVTWNFLDQSWAIGSMDRTAWLYSGTRGYPVAAFHDRLLRHEFGVDDLSGDFSMAIASFIESADVDIEDGDKFGFVRRMLPDVTFVGSTDPTPTINMTIKPRNSSGGGYRQEENPQVARGLTVPVERFTEQVYIRVRGRQMTFRVESSRMGVAWQLGAMRMDVREDGRKGG